MFQRDGYYTPNAFERGPISALQYQTMLYAHEGFVAVEDDTGALTVKMLILLISTASTEAVCAMLTAIDATKLDN
jgi:hypothetical protein